MNLWQFGRKFATPMWGWYLGGTIFLAITNLITLEIPQLAKEIVNALKAENVSPDLNRVALAIIGLGFAQILVRSLSRILIFWPGRRIEETSKSYLFAKAMRLPQSFFDRFGMGDLISRLSNDLGQVRVFFAFAILQVLNLAFIASFTIVMMLSIHVPLTLICLIPIMLMLIITRFLMPILARFSRRQQEAVGSLTNKVTEAFANIHILKANSAENAFLNRAEIENEAVYESNMRVITFRTLFFPLLTSLTGISQMLVLGYGGIQVIEQEITVGDILAFNIYLSYLAFPLTSVGIVLSIFQRSKTAMQRIAPLIHQSDERPLMDATKVDMDESILLKIEGLTYSYPQVQDEEGSSTPANQTVLSNISFELKEGQKIGICGPIGSGKSTLLQLISRIYDPPPGTIFWRNRDILSYQPAELRQEIGYGMQSVHLFSDTIRANITFGLDPVPTDDQLEAIAQNAEILNEIKNLDNGWETQIGEKGVRLSGGQKQRLALARLFARNPRLLLLDDVLSAVDNQTEARLLRYFQSRQKSILLSSHRASVLESCDDVIFLREGRMIDRGPYVELVRKYPDIREDQHDRPEAN
jgi:ATP-binding cassette subfamily B protein